MDLVTVAVIGAAGWISLLVITLALCRAAGRADQRLAGSFSDEGRHPAARMRTAVL